MKTRRSFLCIIALFISPLLPIGARAAPEDFKGDKLGGLGLGMKAAEVIKLLGAPKSKGVETEWGATGDWVEEWTYPDKGLALDMASSEQGAPKAILSVRADKKCGLATSKGIKIGSTLNEVEKAYEKFHEKEESRAGQAYVVGSIYGGMIFHLRAGKVTGIFIGAAAE